MLDGARQPRVRAAPRGEVRAPAQLRQWVALGRAIDDGITTEEMGSDVDGRARDAVLPGGLREIEQVLRGGDLRRRLQEGDALAALLEDGLDLLVGIALRVGGHHDERLP